MLKSVFRLFALIFLAITSPLAISQVIWTPVASNQNFDVVVNLESITRKGDITSARIQTLDRSDRSIMYEDLEISCPLKQVRSIWAKRYNSRNRVTGVNSNLGNWNKVEPDTIMYLIYFKVCK